jgi:hypothetical protein
MLIQQMIPPVNRPMMRSTQAMAPMWWRK